MKRQAALCCVAALTVLLGGCAANEANRRWRGVDARGS